MSNYAFVRESELTGNDVFKGLLWEVLFVRGVAIAVALLYGVGWVLGGGVLVCDG